MNMPPLRLEGHRSAEPFQNHISNNTPATTPKIERSFQDMQPERAPPFPTARPEKAAPRTERAAISQTCRETERTRPPICIERAVPQNPVPRHATREHTHSSPCPDGRSAQRHRDSRRPVYAQREPFHRESRSQGARIHTDSLLSPEASCFEAHTPREPHGRLAPPRSSLHMKAAGNRAPIRHRRARNCQAPKSIAHASPGAPRIPSTKEHHIIPGTFRVRRQDTTPRIWKDGRNHPSIPAGGPVRLGT